MSEIDGPDIERHWNWLMNFLIDYKSIKDDIIHIQSRSMSDPTFSDIDFKKKMALVWTTLNFSNTFWHFSKILCSNLEWMIVNLSVKDMISMMSFYIWCEKNWSKIRIFAMKSISIMRYPTEWHSDNSKPSQG